MNGPLLGVVLCGGKSSRMGRSKSLLPHPDGGRFIDHAVCQLRSVCDAACVAGAANETFDAIGCEFLTDKVAYQGPVSGIVNALQHAAKNDFSACLVTPVDMPHLTGQPLATLKHAWTKNDILTCGIGQDGKLQPLVAIYPIETLPMLQQLAGSADRSLYRWITKQPHQTVLLAGDAGHNVNRPEDL